MRVNADRIVYVTTNPLRFEVCVSSTFIFSLPTIYISCTWSQIVMCCIRWLLQNHFDGVYFAIMASWRYIFSRMHIFNNEEIMPFVFDCSVGFLSFYIKMYLFKQYSMLNPLWNTVRIMKNSTLWKAFVEGVSFHPLICMHILGYRIKETLDGKAKMRIKF